MATVVVPLSSPEHIAGTIAASIAGLKRNFSQAGEYGSRCEALTAALSHLSDHLHLLREDNGQQGDETRRIRLLLKARISASITYSVVHMPNDESLVVCCCWEGGWDPVADGLDKQLNETRSLVEEIASYTKATAGSGHSQEGNRLPAPVSVLSGVSCLTVTTTPSLDKQLQRAEELRFSVVDSSQRLVYTVKIRKNDPTARFGDRRLAASIEIEDGGGHGKRELDIRLPEQPEPEGPNYGPRERRAFLSCSGSLQAEVKSVLPNIDRWRAGPPKFGAATLLHLQHRDLSWYLLYDTRCTNTRLYIPQNYSVELQLSAKVFELGLEGGPVGTFQVKGTKKEFETSYVCVVEQTGEVLAMYHHRRHKLLGVVRFIGVGMHPELRDLIMGALVAMGLDSQL